MADPGNPWTSPEGGKKEELRDLVKEIVTEAISEHGTQAEAARKAAQPPKPLTPFSHPEIRDLVREIIASQTAKEDVGTLAPSEEGTPTAGEVYGPEHQKSARTAEELRAVVREITHDILWERTPGFVSAVPSGPTARKRWWRQFDVARALAAVLVALWLAVTVYTVRQDASETIPDELLGVWTTATPAYADRYFQIARTWLRIDAGEGNVAVYQILKVEEDGLQFRPTYRIDYMGEKNVYTFSFIYHRSPEPVIRFVNQPLMEWRKRTP